MAEDRDRQNSEETDEIGRAHDEDVTATADEDDEFDDVDDEDAEEDEAVEEGK